MQHKWKCSLCDRELRVPFTKTNGKPSIAVRIPIGTVSVEISVHDKAAHEVVSSKSYCVGCADVGLVEQCMEARTRFIPHERHDAGKAEGKAPPPSAIVPCRGCAAMFIHAGHRDDHELSAHPGLKPGLERKPEEVRNQTQLFFGVAT